MRLFVFELLDGSEFTQPANSLGEAKTVLSRKLKYFTFKHEVKLQTAVPPMFDPKVAETIATAGKQFLSNAQNDEEE